MIACNYIIILPLVHRLWGDHGQAMLESAKLCLINATATGCEILKNLILPGIGSFSIIDEHSVTEEDLGNKYKKSAFY